MYRISLTYLDLAIVSGSSYFVVTMMKLKVENLSKHFGSRRVFSKIDFELKSGDSIALIGPNGSGKTTLIKTILGILPATKGKAEYFEGDGKLEFDQYRKKVTLVAPYLNLYDNLTARENLRFLTTVNGARVSDGDIDRALETVGLAGRGEDFAGAYSSGMKQRLKYALMLIRNPEIIFIDEPTSNLDDAGKKIAFDLIKNYKNDAIVIIATNEKEEYALAEGRCQLGG